MPEKVNGLECSCVPERDCRQVASSIAELFTPGDILFLSGEMGAGKTTFTQFLAQALGVAESEYVSSPTFSLVHEYEGRLPIYHMDLYRLQDEIEVEEAGLIEYLYSPGLCVIEWADRLGSLIPDTRLELTLTIAPHDCRTLLFTTHGRNWQQRFPLLNERLAAFRCKPDVF